MEFHCGVVLKYTRNIGKLHIYSEIQLNLAKKVGKVKVKICNCKREFRHIAFPSDFLALFSGMEQCYHSRGQLSTLFYKKQKIYRIVLLYCDLFLYRFKYGLPT